MIQLLRYAIGLLLVMCVACQPVPTSPTVEPTLPPTDPPPTALPPLQVISHKLSPGPEPGEWSIIGLIENQSDANLSQIEINVALLDSSGESIAEVKTGSLLSNLMAGELSPFTVSIDSALVPEEAQIDVLSYEYTEEEIERAELEATIEEFFLLGTGEFAILGYLSNPGSRHVLMDSLSFLGRGQDGGVELVAQMQFGPNQLTPGETVPFLAVTPGNPGAVRWAPFHNGVISAPPIEGKLDLLGEPKLYITSQDAPFVIGTLVNSGTSKTDGSVMITLFDGNRLIGLWEVDLPRSLQAGEQLAFAAFDFPGISLRFDPSDTSDVRVEARLEQHTPAENLKQVELPLDVSAFHSVGSAIFIRGAVDNPTDTGLKAATVYAEVRSSTGELITAGWIDVGALEADGSADFVLDLPIPGGLDAADTEYDLRAIGLRAQP